MLALGIRYLNGFAAAAEHHDRKRPEWPPHPGRVFMALAAAHFQTGVDASEREVLLWLEALPAPAVHTAEAEARAAVTQYVPVPDKPVWKRDKKEDRPPPALQSAPGIVRERKPRTFTRAWLQADTVYLAWAEVEPPDHIRRTLERLCAKVTRIGHPSSLVQMWVASPEEVGEPTWLPDADHPDDYLRVAAPGTLEDLERRYNLREVETFTELKVAAEELRGEMRTAARRRLRERFPAGAPARLRPVLSISQGYTRAMPDGDEPAAPSTVFDPRLVVLTLQGEGGPYRHLDLACVLAVTQRWRKALLSRSNDLSRAARRLLSGHEPNGDPLEVAHLAFLPLAFVGHEHADGRLLGMGLALPAGISGEERRDLLRCIGRTRRLLLGRLGGWRLAPVTAASPPWNLRPDAWTAVPNGATHWSTVTPVAFDRHPKAAERAAYQREVGEMIAQACVRIGLPEPRDVIITPVSVHLGVPPAHAFPRLRRKDGSDRQHVHAILIFEDLVRGPILVGAGRYRGYGFCRPVPDREIDRG